MFLPEAIGLLIPLHCSVLFRKRPKVNNHAKRFEAEELKRKHNIEVELKESFNVKKTM